MTQVHDGVRPTRRCLDDLGLPVPDLGRPLDELQDPIIVAAQAIPERRDVGGVQRIVSLTDRVWFKVKTGYQRAAATQLRERDRPEAVPQEIATWWIGAAGCRRSDSGHHDFYASLIRECTSGKSVSTDALLPGSWDWKRLLAERAIAWRREMKDLMLRLVAMSIRTGDVAMAEFQQYRIQALVRADEGYESYLAIITEGIPDPETYAALLDCVPGIKSTDWQPEPSPLAELDPAPGQVIWSAVMPPEVASEILGRDDDRI